MVSHLSTYSQSLKVFPSQGRERTFSQFTSMYGGRVRTARYQGFLMLGGLKHPDIKFCPFLY